VPTPLCTSEFNTDESINIRMGISEEEKRYKTLPETYMF
jgi:hypothetical protein